jgi:transposase
VLEETRDNQEIIGRVAALDIGKAELVCCIRVPNSSKSGKRLQEVATYQTMTRSLLVMADRLRELGVTRVVMEATSDYWKAPFYLLEAEGFEVWLVNAKDVKHLPGRPKTDKLDAVWLCKVAERQMLRPSFVPPPEIRRLRDLTRYRVDLVVARTAEQQRVEQAAGGRPDQAFRGGLRQLRGLRSGHDGRADRWRARPQGAGAAGAPPPARQARPAGGGVRRPFHRPSRVPARQDARPRRSAQQ